MRYAILGSVQALRDDGTPVAVGGARLRALLTALALRPGRVVPTRLLVDEVWDGAPPADGVAALQALVARLRRALGHTAVLSADGGYRLAAEREDVDLYRFERLARAGAEARDPAEAAARYEEALALWRGPALADLPDPAAEAARWDAVRMEARRGRLAAALALGEAERSLPELTALCAQQPLDEPLQALRIRALRDAGRPAEALSAYDDVRRSLADRLGTDPGPALRALHADLLTPAAPAPTPGPVTWPATAWPRPAPPGSPEHPSPGHPAAAPSAGHPAAASPGYAHGPASGPTTGHAHGPASADALGQATGPGHAHAPGHPADGPAAAHAPAPAHGPAAGHGHTPGRSQALAPGHTHGAAAAHGPATGPGHGSGPADGPAAAPAPAPAHGPVAGHGHTPGPPHAHLPAAGHGHGPTPGAGHAAVPGAGHVAAGGGTQDPQSGPGRGGGNLRARLTTFVGREDDIRVIGDDLARARLVTLLGPGGAGKTRLSQEAAEAHEPRGGWPDGVWLVELAPVDDPEDVAEATLAAVGARETKLRGAAAEELRALTDRNGDDPLDRLAEHCAHRSLLLVLDNCEHVVEAAAELAERLLT
ncbi:AfsR/SARP family transcriptional regulator, partial [Streptomyces erythrochromogenes]|uniref:AfsR/SARP family transcriptional regulator n=1 Tax=Streptomyces erythrochromogenes TaxID=285574 RepID=UPI003405C3C3